MAVTLDLARLERDIPRDSRIAVDTSAAIAYLHGGERASPAASWVFDGCFATGRNPGVISALTVAELLVGPFKAGDAATATLEGFLLFFSELRVAALDGATARVAARVRASTGLALPDAAVVATALAHDAPIVITNDARWQRAVRPLSLPVTVCLLGDYASPAISPRGPGRAGS